MRAKSSIQAASAMPAKTRIAPGSAGSTVPTSPTTMSAIARIQRRTVTERSRLAAARLSVRGHPGDEPAQPDARRLGFRAFKPAHGEREPGRANGRAMHDERVTFGEAFRDALGQRGDQISRRDDLRHEQEVGNGDRCAALAAWIGERRIGRRRANDHVRLHGVILRSQPLRNPRMTFARDARETFRDQPLALEPATPWGRSDDKVERAGREALAHTSGVERGEDQARARCGLAKPHGERRTEQEARVVRGRDVKRLLAEGGIEDISPREHLADALEKIAERGGETLRAPREPKAGGGAHEQLIADDLAHACEREARERLARRDEVRDAMKLAGAEQRLDGLDEPGIEALRQASDEALGQRREAELHRMN